jgi:hypothetical protein
MGFRERLDDIRATPWPALSRPVAITAIVAILVVMTTASVGDRWVPILDSANLAFHEAGHPLMGLLSSRLAVYGGTIFQLAIPVAVAGSFWSRRHTLGFACGVAWVCESLLNVSTYMADARALELPLIGGFDPELYHDWREIFTRWNMLDLDTTWAGLNRVLAWGVGLAACTWLARRARAGAEDNETL